MNLLEKISRYSKNSRKPRRLIARSIDGNGDFYVEFPTSFEKIMLFIALFFMLLLPFLIVQFVL